MYSKWGYIMINYCQLPDEGKKLYSCGWSDPGSPIGHCRFASPCPVYMSECTHFACGACINRLATNDVDRRQVHEKPLGR